MLKRYNIKVKSDLEDPLLGLADRLGVSAFCNSIIIDPDKGEADYILSEYIIVSFIASTIEQDIKFISEEVTKWLSDFNVEESALSYEDYSENQDWMLKFKDFFKPIFIGNNIIVKPPWEKPEKTENSAITILIDPGMAFGTGTHETTRLCLELLKDINVEGKTFYDAGAGSGILSFYMIKAGAKSGAAIEIEEAAVENLKKNMALNNIFDKIEATCSSLSSYQYKFQADCLLANITSPVIIEHLKSMTGWIKTGGLGIFSGINSTNVELVKSHFASNGWKIEKEITESGWYGFHVTKK